MVNFFRLHDSSEKILNNSHDQEAKTRRKKRHRLRIFLLVLDYIVESLGSILIFILLFVAKSSFFQQHALTTACSFVFGIPIPLSYLLSEARVRTIIMENGWLQGIKSIFQSSEKIRQVKIDKILKCTQNDKNLINPFPNVANKNESNAQEKSLDFSEFNHILKDAHVVQILNNVQNGENENRVVSNIASYNVANENEINAQEKSSDLNEFNPISKDAHVVQIHDNVKNSENENRIVSNNASCNRAIHTSSSESVEISHDAQNKHIYEIEIQIGNAAISKSDSYNRDINRSTNKCADISYNAQQKHAGDIDLKMENIAISHSVSYSRAIHPSTSDESDISYISKCKNFDIIDVNAENIDINNLVVSNVRQDVKGDISIKPEIDTFQKRKMNQKKEWSSRKGLNSDVETIRLLTIVDRQNDSTDAITVIGVDSDVECNEHLSSVDRRNGSVESFFHKNADSDVDMIQRSASLECNRDSVGTPSRTHGASEEKIFKQSNSMDCNRDYIKPKLLVNMDATLINSVFVEQSDNVMSILRNADFRLFSRSYIVQRTLQHLTNNESESSDYQKYFQYICDLECYPHSSYDNAKKLHVVVSLINAWHLSKCQNAPKYKTEVSNDKNVEGSVNLNVMEGGHTTTDRTRILNLMLLNVRNDLEYGKLLEQLYIHEEEQRVDELVYGW